MRIFKPSLACSQGIVLVAVLVTISLLTLLLTAAVADGVLVTRSNYAYWQNTAANRRCEQLAAIANKDVKPVAIKYEEQLLNTQPCAMVWTENRSEFYSVRFLSYRYLLTEPEGLCEVIVAKLDNPMRCLAPTLSLQPGLQSWRWLPGVKAPSLG